MPESALWSLVVGLVLLALGLTYKIANLTHRLNSANDEALRWKRKFESLQDSQDEKISDLNKFNQSKIEELNNQIEKLKLAPWQAEHNGPVNLE